MGFDSDDSECAYRQLHIHSYILRGGKEMLHWPGQVTCAIENQIMFGCFLNFARIRKRERCDPCVIIYTCVVF